MPPAALVETHTGIVFFVGDRAYKLKKPVDLGFLNFTTREARWAACLEEVRLNRRFSPDVYLGVADVHGPDGQVCDHLVVMRRMPSERRLSRLVAEGAPVEDTLRAVARSLAAWHVRAPRGEDISAEGTRDALRTRWTDSFTQVRPFHGRVIDPATAVEIEERVLRFLAGRAELFDSRISDGLIVDGHGDLIADDVFCLDDGPRMLDCLEFDDRLRSLDGLDDAAFLAMDLERLNAPELAERFLHWYAEYAADPAPAALRHHYVAYRAFVRAKVACLRYAQGDEHAAAQADHLVEIALRHLRAGTVKLILVGGLPGTGKSTVAGALADRLGCALLSSDRVRKEMAGLPGEQPASAAYGEGLYSPEHTERLYRELVDRAGLLLRLGESVVVDASWTAREHRRLATAMADAEHVDLVELRCRAPEAVAARRLRTRPHGPSDADTAIATAMAARADDWPEAATIDTTGPVDRSIDKACTVARPPAQR